MNRTMIGGPTAGLILILTAIAGCSDSSEGGSGGGETGSATTGSGATTGGGTNPTSGGGSDATTGGGSAPTTTGGGDMSTATAGGDSMSSSGTGDTSMCPMQGCNLSTATPAEPATVFAALEGSYEGVADAQCTFYDVTKSEFIEGNTYGFVVDATSMSIAVTGETATHVYDLDGPGVCDFACEPNQIGYEDTDEITERISFGVDPIHPEKFRPLTMRGGADCGIKDVIKK